jgi:predicted dehydrogenase
MMSDSIRLGIIGAGANTRTMHIPKFQELDGVEIVAVCNRSVESGRAVADEFGIPEVASNWQEIVENPDLDAVLIGTWPYTHCRMTCAALDEGKHVLCEARMAMNADEAHEMYDTSCDHPELTAQIVPSPFTFAFDQGIADLVVDGYLGEILAIELKSVGNDFCDTDSPLSWRQDMDLSGRNVLFLGIWYEALARWVGHARQVTAMSRTFTRIRCHGETGEPVAVRVPDHVDVVADMDCGALAQMRFSAVTGLAGSAQEVWLFGSEGTLHLDVGAAVLRGGRRGDDALKRIEIPEDKRGVWRVEEEFINAIRGLEPVRRTSFSDGVKYMEFTEAVAQSAADGQVVSLPL